MTSEQPLSAPSTPAPSSRDPAATASSATTSQSPAVAVIVATLGTSPCLEKALLAIQEQRKDLDLSLTVVSQGELLPEVRTLLDETADKHLRFPRPLGFAAANNAALGKAWGNKDQAPQFLALVNDDAIIEAGWLSKLVAELHAHPHAAAAQGLNLLLQNTDVQTNPGAETIDGAGIRWNRRLQAVQTGHGTQASQPTDPPVVPIFGASATAAVFRISALQDVAPQNTTEEHTNADQGEPAPATLRIFDEALDTYYEDVDLACRLRRARWEALLVPTALCHHAASSSAPHDRNRLLIANRHLVLARHLGRSYLLKLPSLLTRDLVDFGALACVGWARAVLRMPKFFHLGKGLGAARLTQASALYQS